MIRDTIIKLSRAMSMLGDHSGTSSRFRNLSILVTALRNSSDLLGQLNQNLATVTGLLASDPNKVGDAFVDMNLVIRDVKFADDNSETIGTTADKLASISTALNESRGTSNRPCTSHRTRQNLNNIYEARATATGALAVNNFANPISLPVRQTFRPPPAWCRTGLEMCVNTSPRSSEPAVQLPADR